MGENNSMLSSAMTFKSRNGKYYIEVPDPNDPGKIIEVDINDLTSVDTNTVSVVDPDYTGYYTTSSFTDSGYTFEWMKQGSLKEYEKQLEVLGLELVSGERPDLCGFEVFSEIFQSSSELRNKFDMSGYETLCKSGRFMGYYLKSKEDNTEVFIAYTAGVIFVKNVPGVWTLDRDEIIKRLLML